MGSDRAMLWFEVGVLCILIAVGFWFLGPRPPVHPAALHSAASQVPDLPLLEQWLELLESTSGDKPLIEGVEKHVVWFSDDHSPTDLVVLAVHGWSACNQELRPFDLDLARSLSANLFRTRLPGHGVADKVKGAQALLQHATRDNMQCTIVQAVTIAEKLGKKVVIVGCSTGGTLAVWLAKQPRYNTNLAALVLVSPALVLSPAWLYHVLKRVTQYLPRTVVLPLFYKLIRGEKAGQPISADHDLYWTLTWPSGAIQHIFDLYWSCEYTAANKAISVPVIAFGSYKDTVVDFNSTVQQLKTMSGESLHVDLSHADSHHCVISQILSPNTVAEATQIAADFLKQHVVSCTK